MEDESGGGGTKEEVVHREKHFRGGEMARDIILGMSDGLIVPFSLAVGFSGARASSSLFIIVGLAEVATGAISMGLGR
ncbi:hypothetical protein SUGI_0180680 [Cryptomeria japonica]|nr:hypothetical protein SUGI_0180680 [Cryptomeria japonica]